MKIRWIQRLVCRNKVEIYFPSSLVQAREHFCKSILICHILSLRNYTTHKRLALSRIVHRGTIGYIDIGAYDINVNCCSTKPELPAFLNLTHGRSINCHTPHDTYYTAPVVIRSLLNKETHPGGLIEVARWGCNN